MSASGRIAVVGAGVSGLAAAWRAHRAGADVTVFEASERWGGVVRSERRGPWLVERGPHTLQLRPETARLLSELGLRPEIAGGGRPLKRYLARGRRLVPLPGGPQDLLFGRFFGWRTKARILRRLLGRNRAPAHDLSFADFVRHNFGEEVLALVAQPFVSGIYAGDPEQLSMRHAFPRLWRALQSGSLLRRPAASPLASFPGGLAELPNALARSLPAGSVKLSAPLHSLSRGADGKWMLRFGHADDGSVGFDQVILALPAHAAAGIRIGDAEPFKFLAAIPQPPVTVLNAGFGRAAISHPLDGFGCLVPAIEGRSILGIIFTSTLFPGRAPADHVAITIMLGGALQPTLAKPTAEEAWATARPDVSDLLGLTGEKPVFLEAAHYPFAIPQFTLAYPHLLAAISSAENAHPGLTFGGSYRRGISLPECLGA